MVEVLNGWAPRRLVEMMRSGIGTMINKISFESSDESFTPSVCSRAKYARQRK
ncbi:MAG: hypothetical protein Q9200_002733 [Gallowayella weberi]